MLPMKSGPSSGKSRRTSASQGVSVRGGDRPVWMSPSPAPRNARFRQRPGHTQDVSDTGGDRPVRMSPSSAARDDLIRQRPERTGLYQRADTPLPQEVAPKGGDRPVRMSPSCASRDAQRVQRQALEGQPGLFAAPMGFYRLIETSTSDAQEVGKYGGDRPVRMSPSSSSVGAHLHQRALPRGQWMSPAAERQDLALTSARGPAAHTRLQDQARTSLRDRKRDDQCQEDRHKTRHGARPLDNETSTRVQGTRVRFDQPPAAQVTSARAQVLPGDANSSPQPAVPAGALAPSTSGVNLGLKTPPPAPSGAAPPPAPRKCTTKRKHLGVVISPPTGSPLLTEGDNPLSDQPKKQAKEAGVEATSNHHDNIGGTLPDKAQVGKRKQGEPNQLSLPLKKRRFESLLTLQNPEDRPSTSQTSESAESLLRRHNKHSIGFHPRCAFIRGVLPPTPPKRKLAEPPKPVICLKKVRLRETSPRKALAKASQPRSSARNRPCKRKQFGESGGSSASKKQRTSTLPSSPVPAASSGPCSPVTIPCLNPDDIESVMSAEGCPVKLGSGDFGDVLLMRRKSDGALMAMKRLKNIGCTQKAYREMMAEIKAMVATQGLPEFPRFFGIIDERSFAMEYLGDAQTYTAKSVHSCMLDRSLLTTVDRARISIDVTRGLMNLHTASYLHNDLHNGNALICWDSATGRPMAKIIDLGKACRISKPPPLNCFCKKTKAYYYKNCQQIAPEIVEGTSQCNESSDVHSLGILLKDIALNIRDLIFIKNLGKRCCLRNSARRPTLATVLAELEKFHGKLVARKTKAAQTKA